jgi:heavy metal efflux system protein
MIFKKIIIILFIFISKICSQTIENKAITLSQALQMVYDNSQILRNEKLKTDYLNALTKTAYDLPNTAINSEFGQFNTNLFDVKLGISQSLKLPTVYKNQKKLFQEEAKTGKIEEELIKINTEKQVTQVFYHLLFLIEKQKLLFKIDSIYTRYLEIASLQLAKGESNILQKVEVENQLASIKIQRREIENDYQYYQLKFKYLLNSAIEYSPISNSFKLSFYTNLDSLSIDKQYIIKLLNQERQINLAKIELEKTKLIPDLQLGVYMQSFKFNQPDQPNYLGTIGQIGVSIPFFNSAFKNRKIALEIASQITENKISIESKRLQIKIKEYLALIKKYTETVNYYELNALKNAEIIEKLGGKQFEMGEIKYGELIYIINQSIQLRSNYLDAVNELNRAIINLNYLTNE